MSERKHTVNMTTGKKTKGNALTLIHKEGTVNKDQVKLIWKDRKCEAR